MRRTRFVTFTYTVLYCLMAAKSGNSTFPSEDQIKELLRGYNPKVPPTVNGDDPVQDNLQIYILSMDSISETRMEFAMSFFLRQHWTDSRLSYNFSGIQFVEVDTRLITDIWVPDVYIINEREANFHDITVPNRLLHIYPNGEVFYSVRISGTFTCNMDLRKYPLDKQICDIRFESYAYSAQTIVVRWQQKAAELAPGLVLPQFNLTKQEPYICDKAYFEVNFTCVGMHFHLERNKGYYIIQIYVPSILIIILSWVNFWLTIDAVPARISLGLLTVLTMTTQSSTAFAGHQKVSYIKALDVWLATCLAFVFAALIEFAYVNVTARVEHRRHQAIAVISTLKEKVNNNKETEEGDKDTTERKKKRSVFQVREKARKIDRISRVLFPIAFTIFNIVYWTTYLLWEPVEDD